MKFISYFLLFFVILLAIPEWGCQKKPIEIDRKTRRVIDTLAEKQIKILRIEMDSLCTLNFDKYVQEYVDSIRVVRIEEIKRMMK